MTAIDTAPEDDFCSPGHIGLDPLSTTPTERVAIGEKLRRSVPREVLGAWEAPAYRPDPV